VKSMHNIMFNFVNFIGVTVLVPDLSQDNLMIFRQYTLILKTNLPYYGNRTNTLNIVNLTKYINVNMKTSLFTSSREIISKYVMICN